MSKERIDVVCPCCQATLVVDPKTGLVIRSEAQKSGFSFDEALVREKQRKEKSDELFAKAFENEKKRKSNLEDKFREALDSKDELDDIPVRPWDLD